MIVQTVVKYVVIVAFIFILAEVLKQYYNKVKGNRTQPQQNKQKDIILEVEGWEVKKK